MIRPALRTRAVTQVAVLTLLAGLTGAISATRANAAAGADGPIAFAVDTVFDTTAGTITPGGAAPGHAETVTNGSPDHWVIDATTFTVAAGVTVRFVGTRVPVIDASAAVQIDGTVSVAGTPATDGNGAAPGSGGGGGGSADFNTSGFQFMGASGGGGHGAAGGGGGGYIGSSQFASVQVGGGSGESNYGGIGGAGGNAGLDQSCTPGRGGQLSTTGDDGFCERAATPLTRVTFSSGGGGAGGAIDRATGRIVGGSGGGAGASIDQSSPGGGGGGGAGAVLIESASTITVAGSIDADGGAGLFPANGSIGGGGGGGGAVWLQAPHVFGDGQVNANGGSNGIFFGSAGAGAIDIDTICADAAPSSMPAASVSCLTPPASMTSVSVSPTAPRFGTAVTVTAQVQPTATNPNTPSGSVTFSLDGAPRALGSANLVNGVATLTMNGLPGGANTIRADYGGDDNFGHSSGSVTFTVGGTSTITGAHPGSVAVGSGQVVLIRDATVGAITVAPGGRVDVENSTVSSAIAASGPGALRVCASTVGGQVVITGATGFVLVGDSPDGCAPNTVSGALAVANNKHGVQVIANHVMGQVVASGNCGSGPFPADSSALVTGNGR